MISAPLAGPPDLSVNFTNLEDIQVDWGNVPSSEVPGILIGFTVYWQVQFTSSDLAPNTLVTTPFPIKQRRWRRSVERRWRRSVERRWRRSVEDYFHHDIDTSM